MQPRHTRSIAIANLAEQRQHCEKDKGDTLADLLRAGEGPVRSEHPPASCDEDEAPSSLQHSRHHGLTIGAVLAAVKREALKPAPCRP